MVDGQSPRKGQGLDQLMYLWCETCYEYKRTKICVDGFCPECSVFLCKNCVDFHQKMMRLLSHRILRGPRMPKSFAEKPVKYSECKLHEDKVNYRYCLEHHKMICSNCLTRDHRGCNVQTIYGPRREKTCLRWSANNTGTDQPAHPRSLISAFVIRFFESII